jgi:hypothetical protein
MLARLGVDPAQAPSGGITIIGQGANPALIASGKITDPATGFSSTIDFPDQQLERASALHASGLPVGASSKYSPHAGDGMFIPEVVVRNLLSTPQTVTVTIKYPQPPDPSSASPSSNSAPLDPVAAQDGTHSPPAQQYVIPAFTVPGYSTEDFPCPR